MGNTNKNNKNNKNYKAKKKNNKKIHSPAFSFFFLGETMKKIGTH